MNDCVGSTDSSLDRPRGKGKPCKRHDMFSDRGYASDIDKINVKIKEVRLLGSVTRCMTRVMLECRKTHLHSFPMKTIVWKARGVGNRPTISV